MVSAWWTKVTCGGDMAERVRWMADMERTDLAAFTWSFCDVEGRKCALQGTGTLMRGCDSLSVLA